MGWSGIGLAFIAGLLSTLSPCVLPLLPLVFGSSLSKHKWGPVALVLGVSISFASVGLFVATLGFALGIDEGVFRNIAAVLMLLVGLILMVPWLESRFALAAGPVANWLQQKFGASDASGLGGQFGVGLLLGAVWSPCVGPTLGAASLLAAQGQNLDQVTLAMLLCLCWLSACCHVRPSRAGAAASRPMEKSANASLAQY
jgi:cytochrome c-type biogenesis protein